MLLCHLGVPCELSLAMTEVLKAIAAVELASFDFIAVNPNAPFAKALEGRKHPHALFVCDAPTAEFLAAMADAGAPILVTMEAPAISASLLQRQRKLDPMVATRQASRSYSAVHDVVLSPNAGLFPVSAADQPLDAVIPEIAQFFGLRMTPDRIAAVKQRLLKPGMPAEATLASLHPRPAEPVDGVDVSLASVALAGFEPLLAKHQASEFVWPSRSILGEPTGLPITAPVVLTGMRRCFAYGPFSYLPKGKWRAIVDFTVSENYSGNLLKAEIYTDAVIAHGDIRLPVAGRFSFNLEFEVTDPHLAIQVRLFVWEGAIEGVFELHDTRIERC